MLWKKLVQFGKGFLLIKKKNPDMPLGTAIHNIERTLGKGGVDN
jgi:hypothetical protein